ncbi:MAG: ribonuclease H-like domain-containing protein [Anaerolineae bacterium]
MDNQPALTLSDKLKALGVKLGARDLPLPRTQRDPYGNNWFCRAACILPRTAKPMVWKRCIELALPARPGKLYEPQPRCTLFIAWAGEPGLAGCELERLVFLDTETSGLAGGSGTYAFLIGAGRFEGETFRLAQFFMRDPTEEPAQLTALTDFLHPCDILVTFNGKSFDVLC